MKRNPVSGWHVGLIVPHLFALHVWTRQYAALTVGLWVRGHGGCLHVGDPS